MDISPSRISLMRGPRIEHDAAAMFGGLVHEPALPLAHTLCAMAPGRRAGSSFRTRGRPRLRSHSRSRPAVLCNRGVTGKDRFLCFTDGYHGDTAGAMSVSDPARSMHKAFRGRAWSNSSSSTFRPERPRSRSSMCVFRESPGGWPG